MLIRIIVAVAIWILVALLLVYLVGPILVTMGVPPLVLIGQFLASFGWLLGLIAAVLWYFFGHGPWPVYRRTPRA